MTGLINYISSSLRIFLSPKVLGAENNRIVKKCQLVYIPLLSEGCPQGGVEISGGKFTVCNSKKTHRKLRATLILKLYMQWNTLPPNKDLDFV